MPVSAHAVWRKSRRSGGNDNCVEVANLPGAIGVRDTKDRAAGVLTVPRALWSGVADRIKSGEFDL